MYISHTILMYSSLWIQTLCSSMEYSIIVLTFDWRHPGRLGPQRQPWCARTVVSEAALRAPSETQRLRGRCWELRRRRDPSGTRFPSSIYVTQNMLEWRAFKTRGDVGSTHLLSGILVRPVHSCWSIMKRSDIQKPRPIDTKPAPMSIPSNDATVKTDPSL